MDFASYDELADLTRQAQAGHAGAFRALYDKTAPILRLTIAGKVGFAEAEDILQETYLVAWRNVGKIDPQSVVAYLNATARNLCSNHLRAQGRAGAAMSVDDEAAPVGAAALADHGANPADILTQRDVTERLRAALMHDLDDQERDALLLRYYLDMTNAQAAEQLGVSERTVKRIVARALSTLRHKLSFAPVGADLAAALAAAAHSAGAAAASAGVAGASAAGTGVAATATGAGVAVADAGAASAGTSADTAPGSTATPNAGSDRRWQRTHQLTAAAAVAALLAIGMAAALLGAPPIDEPDPAPVAPDTEQGDVFPLCEETGTADGLTWVRVAAGTHPLDHVWRTDADGTVYLPQPVDDPASPLSATASTNGKGPTEGAATTAPDPAANTDDDAGSTENGAPAGGDIATSATTYVFDLPSGTYELHAADTAGNESHGPLTVTLYPEP